MHGRSSAPELPDVSSQIPQLLGSSVADLFVLGKVFSHTHVLACARKRLFLSNSVGIGDFSCATFPFIYTYSPEKLEAIYEKANLKVLCQLLSTCFFVEGLLDVGSDISSDG